MNNEGTRSKNVTIATDSRGRIFYFDNLKFWLIMLVVIGHFINPVTGVADFYKGIYMFIYTFHMPLFIFVTGYFGKSILDKKTGRFKFEKTIQLLLVYIFLTVVIFLINYYLLENTTSYKFFQPVNPAWYLMSTIIWYCMIPLINSIKPIYVLAGSIVIALLVGMDPMVEDYLTISRAICFFPFFILGYYLDQEKIKTFLSYGTNKIRIFSGIFIIAFLVFCILDPVGFYEYRRIVSPHYSYNEVAILGQMYNLTGPLVRLFWYALVPLVSAAFMMIVPRKNTFYTKLGQRTLQVYVWHSIVVRLLRYVGLFDLVGSSQSLMILLLPLIVSVVLTFVLAWKPFGFLFDWIMKRKFQSILK